MTLLKHLPKSYRPRERLQTIGAGLQLEELVAVLIGNGYKGMDVLELSRIICDRLVAGHSSISDLAAIPGVGLAKSAAICAALQLPDALKQRTNSLSLSDPEAIYKACGDIVDSNQEQLVVFYLTVRNSQIARDVVSVGTATASLAHPREVFRPAITHNASHIVLAHNHPSGEASPSQADLQTTIRMVTAGRSIGIELMDHVICTKTSHQSLKRSHPELFF